ncbi:protein ANTAGONIST OF LIKE HETEROCHROMATIN PROTEIN 1-like [Monomorium pharaonis]|uniref:protein ANTAGONIST OF LIKE HETEROCHROMATIN PROTEIN 1-like n=1 Tax=Monomorium pharaonis TaxID=307658 RepID=UPI001746CB99|nr:protein ANTAGONIST OF LIKE HETEROCHROMATIN PROTEIN 1-like [Monomorium pharaonis]
MEGRRNIILTAICASKQLFESLFSKAVESSDEEEEQLAEAFLLEAHLRLRGSSKNAVRIEGYVEMTVPRFNAKQFREHYRMLPSTFELLENRLGPILTGNPSNKPCIPVRTQLLASLWLLATPDSFRFVGLKHNLAKSSLNASVQRVVAALNDIAGNVIRWPAGDRLDIVKQKFQCLSNMPNVIGAIDGCNISIDAPKEHSLHYKTRKKDYAVVLQAVCDSELRFTDCFAGYPGSVGDRRIFRNSDLFLAAEHNVNAFFPNGEYIIADKAYPVLLWCISPYIDNGRLTRAQKRFISILSKSRQVIERCFALLKGRFRRMKHLEMKRIDLIPSFILACCVLHNICLDGLEECEVEEDNVDDFIEEGLQVIGQQVREDDDDNNVGFQEGEAKRNRFVALFEKNN